MAVRSTRVIHRPRSVDGIKWKVHGCGAGMIRAAEERVNSKRLWPAIASTTAKRQDLRFV